MGEDINVSINANDAQIDCLYELLDISNFAAGEVDLLYYVNPDQTEAMCFTKKSFNHTWYYRFNNTENLLLKVQQTIENRIGWNVPRSGSVGK